MLFSTDTFSWSDLPSKEFILICLITNLSIFWSFSLPNTEGVSHGTSHHQNWHYLKIHLWVLGSF